LAKLHDEFKNSGLVILGIDVQEKKKIVKRYVKKEKVPFPILLDTDGSVARNYGIRSHPIHFLIDRQGKIIGKVRGARNWASDESKGLIRLLVAQK
jgi:peroxiredoxin